LPISTRSAWLSPVLPSQASARLDERHHQAADQLARAALQVALVQHHVEQHADQIDRILVLRVQPRLRRIHAQAGGTGQHFALQPLRQRLAVFADRRAQGRTRRGLQQRQHRHHFALAERTLLAHGNAGRRGGVLAHVAGLLQQFVQGFEQHALVVAHAFAGRARRRAGLRGLHAAAALGPAVGEALRPGRRCRIVVAGQRFGIQRIDQFVQFMARRWRACGRAARGRHLRHHPGGGQLLVQRFITLADRGVQVALAQLDQHQPHFRGQLAVGERLMDGHADMLGADRVAVGIDLQAAGDPAQATVQP
jgi:hypothetical protein